MINVNTKSLYALNRNLLNDGTGVDILSMHFTVYDHLQLPGRTEGNKDSDVYLLIIPP
jgi:hypothetical protein